MVRRVVVNLAVLVLVSAAVLTATSQGQASAAAKVCPTFSSAGLKYFSETVGTGFTCGTAKTWVLKLIKDPADTSSGPVTLNNGPKGYHCRASDDAKGRASVGVCYKGTLAFPTSGFLWNGS